MFRKVLIAEDHEIANLSVQKTLYDFGIKDVKYVYYCDDALSWVKNALRDASPYDLLITDLIFEDDETAQQISNGIDLVKAVKLLQPELKVVVLSAESRNGIVDELFQQQMIDGYVRKGRRDGQYLKEALEATSQHKVYQSPAVKDAIRDKNSHEFSNFDIHVISLLSQGVPQKNIPYYLTERGVKPSGLSSVEKRLNLIREVLDFSKNEQLVAYCKDMGLL